MLHLTLHLRKLRFLSVVNTYPDALLLTHLIRNCCFSNVFPFGLKSLRPWDPLNDIAQFEKNGILQTMERHLSPRMTNHKTVCINDQMARHKVKSLFWATECSLWLSSSFLAAFSCKHSKGWKVSFGWI